MKRHAYLILAHNNFNQLKKLVKLLDDPRNDIFIHIDGKARFNDEGWDRICTHSKLTLLKKRINVRWGGTSIMRSELALLKESTASGEYAYHHLLSGMDLPIKDQDTIHEFFDRNDGKEFLDYWDPGPDIIDRVIWYTPFNEMEHNFIFHAINKACRNCQRLAGRQINRDIDFKYASQWFSITDSLARYVTSREEWLDKTFRHTTICDEIFLPTIVWDSPFKNNIFGMENGIQPGNGNMRFIDWSRGGNRRHPWTFRNDDWELLMGVPHLWARKFNEKTDNEIIERIYRKFTKGNS
ncbi:MAG: glycosyl transferase [Bacteroidetes bacterium]|uniref:Peptide O-xylosyltransferase n=1 Tax=Candidatus Cryptobacteroides merdavium TaxID=2840769 RepID=A0A9D9HB65_9BACT|nr:glycosyl transferase [Candidatus Cryptobacteroides merdavium]